MVFLNNMRLEIMLEKLIGYNALNKRGQLWIKVIKCQEFYMILVNNSLTRVFPFFVAFFSIEVLKNDDFGLYLKNEMINGKQLQK